MDYITEQNNKIMTECNYESVLEHIKYQILNVKEYKKEKVYINEMKGINKTL